MSSLNQVSADFNMLLEIYQQQEVKLAEAALVEENLTPEIEKQEKEKEVLKQELADMQETLKKRKIEFYKFVKIDSRKCEVMNAELDMLKEVQETHLSLLQQISEISKRQCDIAEKCREDLKTYRKQFDSENLTESINSYNNKIEELTQQSEVKLQAEKFEQAPEKSFPELKSFMASVEKPSKTLKEIKDEDKRALALIQTIKEKKIELEQQL